MGSKLAEVGTELGVSGDDLKEMKRQRRRDLLTRLGQAIIPLVSVVLGILAANKVYPVERYSSSYPLSSLAFNVFMLSSSARTYYERRSWVGPLLLSAALFVVTFVLVGLFNTQADGNFGFSPKYSVFSRRTGSWRWNAEC